MSVQPLEGIGARGGRSHAIYSLCHSYVDVSPWRYHYYIILNFIFEFHVLPQRSFIFNLPQPIVVGVSPSVLQPHRAIVQPA